MCDKLNYEIHYPQLPPELTEDHDGHTNPGVRSVLDDLQVRTDTTPTEVLARQNSGFVPLGTLTPVLGSDVKRG